MYCHGFGWNKVNFLNRGLYDDVFWLFNENGGDYIPMLQSSAYTKSRTFLFLMVSCQGGCGDGTARTDDHITYCMTVYSAIKTAVKVGMFGV